MKKYLLITLIIILGIPILALAHQPRLATSNPIVVTEPEISKAYYGELAGDPVIYKISSDKSFLLYVNVLLPYIPEANKDISAVVTKSGQEIARLGGPNFAWEKYHEEFGYDDYWRGSEFKKEVGEGDYEVRVFSPKNEGRYTLAVGEGEVWSLGETMNALKLIPQLKSSFFNVSPIYFIFSPFGWGLILVMFILAFVFGFVYRSLMKWLAERSVRGRSQNIGKKDRWMRFVLFIFFFLWAILTTWNPILFFFAGFCLFEAIFSWCGFYAALGKNTCPV